MKKLYIYIILFILIIFYTGCNQGISPLSVAEENQKAGFSGKISFTGVWPDSVQWTLLVVFKNPLISAASFNIFNVGYISHPIPLRTELYNYSSEQDTGYLPIAAGTYSYVAVAQSNNPVLSLNRSDWKVVGVYYINGNTNQPGNLIIPPNSVTANIDINCNFNNPPPQPPGGN